MGAGEIEFDWEQRMLAYATLPNEGVCVFQVKMLVVVHSSCHAVLTDQVTNETYRPLNAISCDAAMHVYDYILAEAGPLGFEYGYPLLVHKPWLFGKHSLVILLIVRKSL